MNTTPLTSTTENLDAVKGPQLVYGQLSRVANATVALGMTVYNGAPYIEEALTSLLIQTYKDFALVILDDGSADGSLSIVLEFAKNDPRIVVFHSRQRSGMIDAWRSAYQLCRMAAPRHTYFAWCSDHDVLRQNWLSTLVSELDTKPEAVLAYPLTWHIDADGHLLNRPPKPVRFSTSGYKGAVERFKHTNSTAVGVGNIIYGLMRTEALLAIGIYRKVLLPDRLAVLELSLRGDIRQIPFITRFRRENAPASIARQKLSLFNPNLPNDRASSFPWYITHAFAFWRAYRKRSHHIGFDHPISPLAMSIQIARRQCIVDTRKKVHHAAKAVHMFITHSKPYQRIRKTIRHHPRLSVLDNALMRIGGRKQQGLSERNTSGEGELRKICSIYEIRGAKLPNDSSAERPIEH